MDYRLARMNLLWDRFEAARSFVPFIPSEAVGKLNAYPPPPWYATTAPYELVLLSELVSEEYRLWHNDTGYWLNSAFVVSLCALLQDFGIRSADKSVPKWEYIELLIELRNVFAHEDGKYDPASKRHKKIERHIASLLGTTRSPATPPEQFPLSIDTALKPLFLGCCDYVGETVQRASGG